MLCLSGPWRPERSFFKHGLGFLGIAAVTMTGHGFFDEPASAGGRSYAAMKAFCVVILWGVFIGNMTAFLVVLPKYVEVRARRKARPASRQPSRSSGD